MALTGDVAKVRGKRPGSTSLLLVGLALVASIALAGPARSTPAMGEAESLRRLDIMLMVTRLRCRTTRGDFTRDYGRFTRRHMATLNSAQAQLRADLARRYGPRGGQRALDRLNVHMANDYGRGHPWLGCRELGHVAKRLARTGDRADLIGAAREVLAHRPPARLAYARQ